MELTKRPGTSGAGGQYFETKFLALLAFRLQQDDRIEQFDLATNVDEIGNLDDIYFRIQIKGRGRPLVVFMQLKHKDSDVAYLKIDNKTKSKYVDSAFKIKNKINMLKDNSCTGNIDVKDCVFILYTNGDFNFKSLSKFASGDADILHDLIATSDTVGYHLNYAEKEFGENVLMLLAQHLVKFLSDQGDRSMNIMNDEYIQHYHVILKQKVVDVSDIETNEQNPDSKWRTITFRKDFFSTEDEHIALFRDYLYEEILKKHRHLRVVSQTSSQNSALTTDQLVTSFFSKPSVATLTPLICTHVACNEEGKLQFLVKRSPNDKKRLGEINILPGMIEEATLAARTAAVKYLRSLKPLKVPVTFGNMDLAVAGNMLDPLVAAIVKLCGKYEEKDSHKVVTIDDSVDERLLKCSGGLASGVGNIITYNKETNMPMFCTNSTSLPKNARTLFNELTKKINLSEYGFNIKTKKFPKLLLDCREKAQEFLDNFVIYANQGNHSKVEDILKEKIHTRLSADPHYSLINSHSAFLHYHHEVVSWWMSQTTDKCLLTKANDLYEKAIKKIMEEPQINLLHATFHMNNLRYFRHSFIQEATVRDLPEVLSKVFVVTDTVSLTAVKIIQCIRERYSIEKYAVLDLENIFNMSTADFCTLDAELRITEKVVIIVWRNMYFEHNRLTELVQASKGRLNERLIVIAHNDLKENVKTHFSCANNLLKFETESLSEMETRGLIIRDARVMFQGQEVSLDFITDDESAAFVKGDILDKLILNETINIGTPLSNPNFDEIKDLYVDRRLSPVSDVCHDTYNDSYLRRTFHDIVDDVVLMSADPGMGKSTLLTHLSLNTKESNVKLWIVRVNFLDHCERFSKWHEDKIVVDTIVAITFLCQVALRNENISVSVKITNEAVPLVNWADIEKATFEMNLFLHFYNQWKLIFVFDGFDEICPYYKDKVVDFLKVAKTLRKNKMWVTSRPYSDILLDLQRVLGRGFKIEHLSTREQHLYLKSFWQKKFKNFNDTNAKNVQTFIDNTKQSIATRERWIFRIYCIFYNFVRPHLSNPISEEEGHYLSSDLNDAYNSDRSREDYKLSGSPLFLYFIADYFTNVADIGDHSTQSVLGIDKHHIYEMFIENKLKKILLRDKNNMNLYNTITKKIIEDLTIYITTYKKLAAYALLQGPIFRQIDCEEFREMNPIYDGVDKLNALLSDIKKGTDKTGLISHVTTDNVPVFIHRTFTEYFTAGYVCDILQSSKFNLQKKTLWHCAILEFGDRDVNDWLKIKRQKDEKYAEVCRKIEYEEPQPLFKTPYYKYFYLDRLLKSEVIRIMSSSVDDYERGCFDEYVNIYTDDVLNNMARNVLQKLRCTLTKDIIDKMRPHLKIHFRPGVDSREVTHYRHSARSWM